MELQLGLALPTNPSKLVDHNSRAFHNKRTFSQLFEHESTNSDVMLPTLSLLPLTPSKNDEEEESLVGWPPVNYWRKKLRTDNYVDDEVVENDHMVWIRGHGSSGGGRAPTRSNNLYVKVKMEGVGIARKVNLNMHHSFQTLKETLMNMFGKCHQQSNGYELAFQDKEGDWLLAEDVPWRQVHANYNYSDSQTKVLFSVCNGSNC